MKITVDLGAVTAQLLAVLGHGSAEEAIKQLIDHAQQGVYRPGAWERAWVRQVFGDDWEKPLEGGDPYGQRGCEDIFQRPTQAFLDSLRLGHSE